MNWFMGILYLALICLMSCASSPDPDSGSWALSSKSDYAVSTTIWDGVFTGGQARRGEGVAQSQCGLCHSIEIEWKFALDRWMEQPVLGLFDLIRTTMPHNYPGGLERREYADIVAYILHLNGAPTGPTELSTDGEELAQIVVTPPPGP